jgi:hypothetical protein
MRVSDSQRLLLAVIFTVALIETIPGYAQTTSTAAPSTTPPTSPTSAAKPTQPDDLQWNPVDATAQCQDGTFFHGLSGGPGARTCADHGGVRKWLRVQGREHPLIR